MSRRVFTVLLLGLLGILTAGCALAKASAALPTPAPVTPPLAATSLPPGIVTPQTLAPFRIPTADAAERRAAPGTRLYLSAFQSFSVTVVDPQSGHALKEIQTSGDRAGVAIAPDGKWLYVVDGQVEGVLHVYDTATWQINYRAPVPDLATLFSNPVSLSPDGRWLFIARYHRQSGRAWLSVFDTLHMVFLPDDAANSLACSFFPPRLAGLPGDKRMFASCPGSVSALDAKTLSRLWQVPATAGRTLDLAVSRDGTELFGLEPRVETVQVSAEQAEVISTDLHLTAWDASNGRLLKEIRLSDQVTVPAATIGRGEGAYLRAAPDGTRFYLVWEDRVWALAADSLQVLGELKLPAPIDGVALSEDGRELYLLPATAGDLRVREHGMWAVSTAGLQVLRHIADWPTEPNLIEATLEASPAPRCVCGE